MNPRILDLHRASYHKQLSPSPESLGEAQPALELPLEAEAVLIELPNPREVELPAVDLRQAIEQRRSRRHYRPDPITLEELSSLLWLTQGVKEVTKRPATRRTVPSAGARHAFETLLLVQNVAGLEAGLYRFVAGRHALTSLNAPADIAEQILHACWDQKQIASSAVTFLWVAEWDRMAWRYVERGYRYLHLDAGHVCQNLYLAAEAVGCGVCAIASYDDETLNRTLGLDGESQFVIYLASVGKR